MSLFVRETRHPISPMSNLLSSFPRKRMPRMVRIKDTTCGFPPLFSLAPLFSSPSNDEKCSGFFVAPSSFFILSPLSILSLVAPFLSISFSNSYPYSYPFSSFEDYCRMQKHLKLSLKCCFCSAIRGSRRGFR